MRYDRLEVAPLPDVAAQDEGLTGYVHGLEASDLEERFARALDKYAIDYGFQVPVDTAYTLPGQAKVVDFMVYTGMPRPVEVDGEFTHKTTEQHEADRERDAQINGALRERGYSPVMRITYEDLIDQDHANATVENYIA